MATARNRAIDRIRRDRTLAAKVRELDVRETTEDDMDETLIEDERLELLFTCCHPALALDAQGSAMIVTRTQDPTTPGIGANPVVDVLWTHGPNGLLAERIARTSDTSRCDSTANVGEPGPDGFGCTVRAPTRVACKLTATLPGS